MDLRSPDSYQNGHIPETICLSEEFLESMTEGGNPFDTCMPLIFCCPLGEKSGKAAAYFASLGHLAYSLKG
ncbi:MAG: rhodanese-like domain-containing protein [Patescibacteria group bacterium]